jgi:opacity protein-like surface antigen
MMMMKKQIILLLSLWLSVNCKAQNAHENISVVPMKVTKGEILLLPGIVYQPFQPYQISYSAMVGIVKNNGGYIKYQSNFISTKTELDCNDSGTLIKEKTTPWYKETSQKARMSITAGLLHRLNAPVFLYAGAGYGSRVLVWETLNNERVRNIDHSVVGLATEGGLIFQFDRMLVSGGITTINFKYAEVSFGVGLTF